VPWVVDTCVLIDVAEDDPQFGKRSARLLDRRRSAGLLVAPVSYVELAPLFNGISETQNEFLESIGVNWTHSWTWPDTAATHGAWHRYIVTRRRGGISKRPIADILIGAFAIRFDGLLTRNVKDFGDLFPDLRLEQP
jgi:predicted nucleic acid-binding protein